MQRSKRFLQPIATAYSAQDSPTFNALADQWHAWGNRNMVEPVVWIVKGMRRETMLRMADQVEWWMVRLLTPIL
jgi:hypothetical protein